MLFWSSTFLDISWILRPHLLSALTSEAKTRYATIAVNMVTCPSLFLLATSVLWLVPAQSEEFRGCDLPPVEWVTASAGTSSFWVREGAVVGNGGRKHLVAVGDLRPTDPTHTTEATAADNFLLRGPHTAVDPTGLDATTIRETVLFDFVSDEWNGANNEIGILVMDVETGQPIDVVHFGGSFHSENTYAVAGADVANGTAVAVGGRFTGSLVIPDAVRCTPSSLPTVSSVTCTPSTSVPNRQITSLAVDFDQASVVKGEEINPEDLDAGSSSGDTSGFEAYLISLRVASGAGEDIPNPDWLTDVQWAIIPWFGTWQSKVFGTAVQPGTGHVYASGVSCEGAFGEPTPTSCQGHIGMFDADTGAQRWLNNYPAFDQTYEIDYDSENDILIFTAYHRAPTNVPDAEDTWCDFAFGCFVTGALSGDTGDLIWYRAFEDASEEVETRAVFSGEAKLAHENDG